MLTLRSGAVVVLEGLDRTGKSTQLSLLRRAIPADSVLFAHMPRGLSSFTERIDDLLKDDLGKPTSGLAQQLAHLACHAESMGRLTAAVSSGALVLDRWWWSTLAYGWYGSEIVQSGLSEATFQELISTIWSPIVPSVVFVLLEPHLADDNNSRLVDMGYRLLIERYPDLAVEIPQGPADLTHHLILETLIARGICSRGT